MASARPLLREARQSARLTQRELADRLGVPQPAVARWEAGVREPGVRVAVRMSEELGTTANAIWPPDLNEEAPAPLSRPRA